MSTNLRRRHALAALFVTLFALSQALLWFAYYGNGAKPLIGDEANYQANALAILAGGAWMPGTIWPPLQALFIALVYALCGPHLLAVQLAQTVLFVGCAALLRDLWRKIGGSVAAANTAAALFVLNPATAAYAHWLWPEIVHLFLLLAALCLLARATSAARAVAAGACIGLAILAKSLLSVFWPLFLLAFVRPGRSWFRWRAALGFVLGIGLLTAPALLHGWRSYGTPMIADSSIYNLWVGLTDRWRSDYVEDMGGVTLPAFLASGATPQQRNAVYLDKLRALVAERGVVPTLAGQLERQYFRLFSAKTPLLSQLPGAACAGHLSVYRTAPWLTRTLTAANDLLHALTLAAAALGLACWRWRGKPGGGVPGPNPALVQAPGMKGKIRQLALRALSNPLLVVVVLLLGYQIALFALIHVKARFLLPMLPFLCGFGGSFLAAWRSARSLAPLSRGRDGKLLFDRGENLALTAPRLAFGALLAAVLLFLAFAGPALDRLCAG